MRVKSQILAQWVWEDRSCPEFSGLIELREDGRLWCRVLESWTVYYPISFDERRNKNYAEMVEKAHQFIVNLVDSHRGSRTWGYFHFTLAFRRKNPEKVVKEATIAERREQIRERVGDIF